MSLSSDGAVALITIDHPPVNALSKDVRVGLVAALEGAIADTSVRAIVLAEGLSEHPRKTRVMRQANRQEVTGVTVNVRPSVSRKEVRQLRAILHNAAKHGLASQNRGNHPNFAAYLKGRVEFVCMVDPQRAPALREALRKALAGG